MQQMTATGLLSAWEPGMFSPGVYPAVVLCPTLPLRGRDRGFYFAVRHRQIRG